MNTFSLFLEDYNKKINLAISDLPKDYREYLKGGKRIRGALVLLGFELFGGKQNQDIIRASLAAEIAHSAFLIHDDFIDQDSLRRGEETVHKKYSRKFGEHFGASMAVNIGDKGFFLSFKLLNSLNFSPKLLIRANKYLNELFETVVRGQILDITLQKKAHYSKKEVLDMYKLKTARYTIPGPLSLGAILAGASSRNIALLEEFGAPLGLAFQLKDDEMDADSDVKEGKITLLSSKGLDYSRNLSNDLIKKSKEKVKAITKDKKGISLLEGLADLVYERRS